MCRADRSLYHALGYATVMYLQAAMTFEAVSNGCCLPFPVGVAIMDCSLLSVRLSVPYLSWLENKKTNIDM